MVPSHVSAFALTKFQSTLDLYACGDTVHSGILFTKKPDGSHEKVIGVFADLNS